LPKNGATPNFVEFKDQNNNVVASISTEGDLNVVGSITVNGSEEMYQYNDGKLYLDEKNNEMCSKEIEEHQRVMALMKEE
jgi:hypothetical protein